MPIQEIDVREYTWGEGHFDYELGEKEFVEACQLINEKFLIGKAVRIIVPNGTPVTPEMVNFFIWVGSKAQRSHSHLYLRVCGKIAAMLEQVPGTGAINIERL